MKKRQLIVASLLLVMKITMVQIAFSIFFACTVNAKEANSPVILLRSFSLSVENTELSRIISSVQNQTKVRFSFNSNSIRADRRISYKAVNKTIREFIDEVLTPSNIGFRVINDEIILSSQADGQNNQLEIDKDQMVFKQVSGTITDDEGRPLGNVSVMEKGTSNGTTTNNRGYFSLTVSTDDAVLVVSFVGYSSQEISVAGQSVVTAKLLPANREMAQVVVVGYGTQRKKDVTGSIARIGGETIRSTLVNSPDQAIQGRVAGVQVVQSSGAPGGAVQVRIRGVNSTAGGGANQPLYVVDGVPLLFVESINSLSLGNEGVSGGAGSNGASPLNTINPNDIESIDVLKDASATAIYGARAANGVVLITTKSGRIGKPQVNVNVSYGIQSLREKIPVLNAREYVASRQDHRRNRGSAGNEVYDIYTANPFLFPKGTDWQDELFDNARIANYNVGVSGGSDRVTYAVSSDYMDHQGIIINTFSRRTGIRVNMDVKATEKLKFGTRTNLSKQWENGVATDEFFQSDLNGLTTGSPVSPVYDANGNFAGRPNTVINGTFWGGNPVATVKERIRNVDRHRILSNIYGEYNILSNLRFRSSLGVDYLLSDLRQVDPYWVRGVDINSPVRVSESRNSTYNWVAEQTLSYDKAFGEHRLNAVGGFTAQNVRIKTMFASANGSVSNALNQLGNNPTFSGISGGINDQGLVSQFIRTNYAFKGRYLFTGTVRRDGSSRFGSNYQYGYFPSASVGWRLSDEAFLRNNKIISDLKLRVSYGSTGNQNIGDFLYAALMGGSTGVFGDTYTPGLVASRFQNEDIQWERNNQMDIGLDVGLFQNRLRMTVEYYDKRTKGLLAPAPMSVISGVGNSFITNIGEIRNSGFEFTLNSDIIQNKSLTWNVDFNISTNRNEVVSLGSQPFINGASVWRVGSFVNRTEVGHPIGAFYLVQTDGQYQTWQEAATAPIYRIQSQPWFGPGDPRPVDQNKDGIIDDNDRVWSGSPFPDLYGGFTSTLNYKNWSFMVFAPFQSGNKIWNQPYLNASIFEGNTWRSVYENRWTPSNPQQTSVPIPRQNNPILAAPLYLQDGSFLRLRTISLGYQVPVAKVKFMKLSNLRVFAQANNFFVFTNYQGWDPEVNSFGSNVTTNAIDIGAYPQAKSVVFGLNVGF